jgi:methionyl-tRNA formyltransferase
MARMIVSAFPDAEFQGIIATGLYYKKTNVQSIIKMLRECSVYFCLLRAIGIFFDKIKGRSLESFFKRSDISYIKSADINNPKTVEHVRALDADLLISLYTMHLYKEPLISTPRYGSINSHPSLLPKYRGLETLIWVLGNEEIKTGQTVFFLEERLDDGNVILQEEFAIPPNLGFEDLYVEQAVASGDMLCRAIQMIDNDTVETRRPEGTGSYFPMPDAKAFTRFRKTGRRFFRTPGHKHRVESEHRELVENRTDAAG